MPQKGKLHTAHPSVTSWAARYGQAILRDGIAAIPSALYRYQGILDLSAQEVWLISAILAHKWDADLPYPSLKQLSEQSRIDLRWLKRLRAGLCAKGLLVITERYDSSGRQGTNSYDFSALFARLEELIAADPPPQNDIRDDSEPADPPATGRDNSFSARFGRVIASAGIAAVPQAIFTHQAALGLTPQQVWFTCYILAHRWTTDLPHPSLSRMVERTGYSRRQIQTIKDELVAAGYLQVVPRFGAGGGKDSNGYDFSALLDAITTHLQHDTDTPEPEPAPVPTAQPTRSPRRGRRPGTSYQEAQHPGGSVQHMVGGSIEHIVGGSIQHMEEGSTVYIQEGSLDHMGGVHTTQRRGATPAHRRGVIGAHKEETEQEEPEQKSRDSNPHASSSNNRNGDAAPPLYSPIIAGVVTDISRELGDLNILPNVSQAHRLWQASGLAEADFVAALRTAKLQVRKAQAHGVANKGAYWMAVLRDQLGVA